MSTKDLLSTTSRHAIIYGMTNTDQVGMQQANAPQRRSVGTVDAEQLPDAGDGGDAGGGDEGDVNPETGLTPEQEAEFEAMRTGDPAPPADGGDVGDDNDEPDAGDDATDPQENPPAPLGKEKTPAELAADKAAGQRTAPKTININKHQRLLKQAQEDARLARESSQKDREERIKLAERVSIINEAIAAQQAAQQAPVVDPNAPPANPFEEDDIDPTEDYAESVKQIQRRQHYQVAQSQRVEEDVTESRQDREMKDTFTRDFQATAARDENVPLAYQWLKDSRLTEICISEFDKDPNDKNEVFTKEEVAKMVQIFNAEEKWVVGNALKQGKSPTAAIMKIARARGFKPPSPAQKPVKPLPGTNGVRPPAAAPRVPGRPAPAPSAADLLDEQEAALEAGRSLSDGGGAPPSGLSAEILLGLDDEEFAEMVDNLSQGQLNALLGK